MVGADLVHLHHLASPPPPHLLHLALHVVEVLGTPQPSEEQEDEKAEEDNTEAARQGKGENVSQFEIKVEGDVLLRLSSALLHRLLLVALHLLLHLLAIKQQFRTCNHSCAGDSQELKAGVGGGQVDAGQEGGGGGGDQVQLAPHVLGSEEEDGWLGGGEVPCDGAVGKGEGGEEEGRCRWRWWFASCLTTSCAEERGRTEGEGRGGGAG